MDRDFALRLMEAVVPLLVALIAWYRAERLRNKMKRHFGDRWHRIGERLRRQKPPEGEG